MKFQRDYVNVYSSTADIYLPCADFYYFKVVAGLKRCRGLT